MKTSITPVSYGPLGLANTLAIRGIGSVNDTGCPNYFYAVQRVTDAAPGVPAEVETIATGNKAMTSEQWAKWGSTESDEDYQLTCIAANLGLDLA